MSAEGRLLLVLKQMNEQLRLTIGRSGSIHVEEWIAEVAQGHAVSPKFRSWLENQVDYHGPKDRPYATYMRSLLEPPKEARNG